MWPLENGGFQGFALRTDDRVTVGLMELATKVFFDGCLSLGGLC